MSENSSADAIALRREARRRRILENAESRLRTITGNVGSSSYDPPKPDIFHSLHNDFHNENSFDEVNQEISIQRNILKDLPGLNESFHYNADEEIKIKSPIHGNTSYIELIIQKRLHYILLSLIIHTLLFFKLGFTFYNNLLCPFITVKLIEYILVQSSVESPQPSILNLVPSFSKGHVITYILKTYSIVMNLFSDFFLYIFIFVSSDKLFNAVITGLMNFVTHDNN